MPSPDLRASVWASLSFALVMALVGWPMWWKTTEIAREPLPYGRIAALAPGSPLPVLVRLVSRDAGQDHQLGQQLQRDLTQVRPSAHYAVSLQSRTPTASEERLIREAANWSELDAGLRAHQSAGSIRAFEVDRPDLWPTEATVLLGRFRTVYFRDAGAGQALAAAIRHVMLDEASTRALLASLAAPNQGRRTDASVLRRVTDARGYDLLFSLLLPDGVPLTWPIEAALQRTIEPFLDSIQNYSRFSVKSQVLFLTSLNLKPRAGAEGAHYVTARDCGLAINPVESQLASHVSSHPRLNFLLYVSPAAHSPLFITREDEETRVLESNAFLIPRWGGVAIHNQPTDAPDDEIALDQYTDVFLSQLRLLLGLQRQADWPQSVSGLAQSRIRLWEYDYLLRTRTLENLVLTRLTLQSLSHLLTQISNIVINEAVGERVMHALETYDRALAHMAEGDLAEGFQASKEAFLASEEAFFDPTLLGLLYFPEDQKYAIYVPLFLPVGIPVFMSMKSIVAYFTSKSTKVD
eukprot:maker-scaffold308_size214241-snap-gene-0.26 protein:Tk09045 transcript:maker-scaffold308_size214241-snap-gene-0.26-mRNA-1 annotation:"gpi transamidase component pig-s-like"